MERIHSYEKTEIRNCGSERTIKRTVGEITYLLKTDWSFVAFVSAISIAVLSFLYLFGKITVILTKLQLEGINNPSWGEISTAAGVGAFISLIILLAGMLGIAILTLILMGMVWCIKKTLSWWKTMRRITRLKIVSLGSTFTVAFGASAVINHHWVLAFLSMFVTMVGLGYITAHIWGLDAHPWFLDD